MRGAHGRAYDTDFSSRGAEVDFIAPGVDVKSSVPGGKYDLYDGTSMATPHVAGLAALAVARGAKGPSGVRAATSQACERPGAASRAAERRSPRSLSDRHS